MPQPMPPPPPPKPGGIGLIPWLIIFVLAVAVFGYFSNWFSFEKGEDGKTKLVMHGDKFKADKDAALKVTKDGFAKLQEKVKGMMSKKDTAKAEEKDAIQKQIDDLEKQLAKLKEDHKKAEEETDPAKFSKAKEGLDETVKKLLDNPK